MFVLASHVAAPPFPPSFCTRIHHLPAPPNAPYIQNKQAFVTLGGLAAAVLSALQEASSTDAATDWPGLVAGFLGGLALGWQVAPAYKLQLVEASTRDPSASVVTAAATSGVGSQQGVAAAGGKGGGSGGGADSESFEGDLLLPVLKDSRQAAARANAVVGYAAVLFAVLGGWLLQQGSS